jgi:hypothetical protein
MRQAEHHRPNNGVSTYVSDLVPQVSQLLKVADVYDIYEAEGFDPDDLACDIKPQFDSNDRPIPGTFKKFTMQIRFDRNRER